MSYHAGISCAHCNGHQFRREVTDIATWTAFKCLDDGCSTIFALYDYQVSDDDE